jgi:hypothetical protein
VKKVIIIPVLIVVLILVAFATTDAYRVPTIQLAFVEQRPGNVATATLTVSGVKCRGTSMLCAEQLQDVPGVVGITTYARTHTVIVEYDPDRTDVATLEAAICEPIFRNGQRYDVFSITE